VAKKPKPSSKRTATASPKSRTTSGGETHQIADGGPTLTTNQGTPISDNQNSLRAGTRGPTMLEDFIFREKITHFDHERIPERIVHARGSGAHGFFQPYKSMAKLTRAAFLQDGKKKTPVFVRFSKLMRVWSPSTARKGSARSSPRPRMAACGNGNQSCANRD